MEVTRRREHEYSRLKRMSTDLSLENQTLQDVIAQNKYPGRDQPLG